MLELDEHLNIPEETALVHPRPQLSNDQRRNNQAEVPHLIARTQGPATAVALRALLGRSHWDQTQRAAGSLVRALGGPATHTPAQWRDLRSRMAANEETLQQYATDIMQTIQTLGAEPVTSPDLEQLRGECKSSIEAAASSMANAAVSLDKRIKRRQATARIQQEQRHPLRRGATALTNTASPAQRTAAARANNIMFHRHARLLSHSQPRRRPRRGTRRDARRQAARVTDTWRRLESVYSTFPWMRHIATDRQGRDRAILPIRAWTRVAACGRYLSKLLGDPVHPTRQATDDDDTDHGSSDSDMTPHSDGTDDDGDDSSVSTVVRPRSQRNSQTAEQVTDGPARVMTHTTPAAAAASALQAAHTR